MLEHPGEEPALHGGDERQGDDHRHPAPVLVVDEHGLLVVGDEDALEVEDGPLPADGDRQDLVNDLRTEGGAGRSRFIEGDPCWRSDDAGIPPGEEDLNGTVRRDRLDRPQKLLQRLLLETEDDQVPGDPLDQHLQVPLDGPVAVDVPYRGGLLLCIHRQGLQRLHTLLCRGIKVPLQIGDHDLRVDGTVHRRAPLPYLDEPFLSQGGEHVIHPRPGDAAHFVNSANIRFTQPDEGHVDLRLVLAEPQVEKVLNGVIHLLLL